MKTISTHRGRSAWSVLRGDLSVKRESRTSSCSKKTSARANSRSKGTANSPKNSTLSRSKNLSRNSSSSNRSFTETSLQLRCSKCSQLWNFSKLVSTYQPTIGTSTKHSMPSMRRKSSVYSSITRPQTCCLAPNNST